MDQNNEVFLKAQELGEAILNCEIRQRMLRAEEAAQKDPEATGALAAYMENQSKVQEILGAAKIDPNALSVAAAALEEAEKRMNELAVLQEMQEARKEYNEMMESLNRILNMIVTGKLGDEQSGCSGSCSTCGGCH